ncbi:TraR/DksA family transcriptional regulator [Polluticoccus soli]|uniref:TraR/DksA family transcriptional regulator n=1 Tax=Polluticoccus soli TaxID=3034150 RepID=UPI0023E168B8|nr:TraR/DksA C4-type zinc finger protein [Flavipsychrobacter sp. JY13-12]
MQSAPSKQATPIRAIDKKPNVVVAHRRLENKAKEADKAGKTMINYQPEYTRSILDEPQQLQGPVYRYSDEELAEFKELITGRLESARKELAYLQGLITRKDEAGTEDTENRYASMEDGSGAMEREQLAQLASRQIQFINHLEKAMVRIENKTYGICRVTGKLIDKARLRAVPHATLSIEAKKTMTK